MRHPAAVFLGALLLGALPAAAQKFEVPALVVPPSAEHHVGKVIWTDLVTPDLAAAEKFYSGLFGWTFRELRAGDKGYAVALLDGRPVAGLFQRPEPPGERKRPAWLGYISVRDADAAKATALAHGAKVVFEPRTFAQRGRQAVLSDPEGAVFGVLASTSGDPGDYLVAPGDWIWSALLARDPDTEAAFYQTLIGYDVFDLPTDDGLQHVVLSSDDYARAGVNHFPSGAARRYPHWVNFVRVIDASASAARAVALGGRILVEPHVDRHGSNVALIADPAGALVGLMEWSDADGKEKEPK
jgi:predicted enzyme related to lactoylglutathione lyase